MPRCFCRTTLAAPLLTAVVACGYLAATLAHAGDGHEAVEVQIKSKVHKGHAPVFIVNVNKALASLRLELRSKGKTFTKTKTHLKAGSKVEITLPHTHEGTKSWRGDLTVMFEDGSDGKMPVTFTTEVVGTLKFEVPQETLDLKGGSLVVKMSRSAGRVDVEVTGVSGALLANVAKEFDGEASGTPLKVTWLPKLDEDVLRLKVVVHDTEGFYSPTLELFPFSTKIAHQEIIFASGQSAVTKVEEQKLLNVVEKVKTLSDRTSHALKQTGAQPGKEVRLFILGHTDTVGAAKTNQRLSEARARSIGTWFAAHHIVVPIFARGFGEKRLEVMTVDNVDEVRNRRVDYVLAIESPTDNLDGWFRVH